MSLTERTLERWYDPAYRALPWRPLGWLYRAIVAGRAGLYRRGWLHSIALPVPVIVVGNISIGGTGKTPLVMRLVAYLQEQGWRPGVVSRGYGGTEDGPCLLPECPDPARFGDEPSLARRRTGVPVAIGRRRPEAARLLLDAGVDVIVSDDGLQHYRLRRDVEVCVIDGVRRFGNGLMFPCGPLREPPSRLRRVDFQVVNGGAAGQGEVPMNLTGGQAHNLGDPAASRELEAFAGQTVHAVAGIGRPRRFFDGLKARGLVVIEHAYPDHHAYTAADVSFGDGLPVLMTEKDAVKCAAFATSDMWCVPVEASVPTAFLEAVLDRVHRASESNHRASEGASGKHGVEC